MYFYKLDIRTLESKTRDPVRCNILDFYYNPSSNSDWQLAASAQFGGGICGSLMIVAIFTTPTHILTQIKQSEKEKILKRRL